MQLLWHPGPGDRIAWPQIAARAQVPIPEAIQINGHLVCSNVERRAERRIRNPEQAEPRLHSTGNQDSAEPAVRIAKALRAWMLRRKISDLAGHYPAHFRRCSGR